MFEVDQPEPGLRPACTKCAGTGRAPIVLSRDEEANLARANKTFAPGLGHTRACVACRGTGRG